jgi:hypothetical protein
MVRPAHSEERTRRRRFLFSKLQQENGGNCIIKSLIIYTLLISSRKFVPVIRPKSKRIRSACIENEKFHLGNLKVRDLQIKVAQDKIKFLNFVNRVIKFRKVWSFFVE